MRRAAVLCSTVGALLSSAVTAFAHTGGRATFAFEHGFAHPFGGMDHLLAMLCVGLAAAVIGGRALLVVPLAFLGAMVAGALLGMWGVAVPAVELGVGASVLLLGILLATGIRPGLALAAVMVGAFALFHGHAHGGEMPAAASGLGYVAGFAAATALLHLAGIGLGLLAGRLGPPARLYALRCVGGAVAAAGVALVMRAV